MAPAISYPGISYSEVKRTRGKHPGMAPAVERGFMDASSDAVLSENSDKQVKHGRCRAWRPLTGPSAHHPAHEPGKCRACWKPCFRKTTNGTGRCDECMAETLHHPAATVRISLATEPDLPLKELRTLVADRDGFVASAARWSLDRRLPPVPGTAASNMAAPDTALSPPHAAQSVVSAPDWGDLGSMFDEPGGGSENNTGTDDRGQAAKGSHDSV